MKKTIKILLGLILIAGAFAVSCKKDKASSEENYIAVNGTKHNLSFGVLETYGRGGWHDGYNLDLYLCSNGVSFPKDGKPWSDFKGKGNYIYFELVSNSINKLDEGKYDYFDDEAVVPINSFDYADYAINYNFDDDEDSEYIEIYSGSV